MTLFRAMYSAMRRKSRDTNIIPPYSEWALNSNMVLNADGSLSTTVRTYCYSPFIAINESFGSEISVSYDCYNSSGTVKTPAGRCFVNFYDSNKQLLLSKQCSLTTHFLTNTFPAGTAFMRVQINQGSGADSYEVTFANHCAAYGGA